MKNRYRDSNRLSNWGIWRDLIRELRADPEKTEIVVHEPGAGSRVRASLASAAHVQKVQIQVLPINERALSVRVCFDIARRQAMRSR
jgi:hypothetical protein